MIFSIIVPFLNEEKYIKDSALSLLNPDFNKDEYEIIFIDNGSTDNSVNILKQYPKIKLLHETKKSSYAARNKGLSVAKGSIIAFTDADCIASKDWLSTIKTSFGRTEASILIGKRKFKDSSPLSLKILSDYENMKASYTINSSDKKYFMGYTNNMAVKAELFKDISGFSEIERGGDTEFIHKILDRNPETQIKYSNDMLITHLEINSLMDYYIKISKYAKNNKKIEKKLSYKKLSYRNKINIYNKTCQEKNYSYFKKIYLATLLLIGDVVYNISRL